MIYDGLILQHIHTGTFPMDRILKDMVFLTVFIEIEVPVWYVLIAETMPQYQMECFTVQFLISTELIKIYMLESTHQKMVNYNIVCITCHLLNLKLICHEIHAV